MESDEEKSGEAQKIIITYHWANTPTSTAQDKVDGDLRGISFWEDGVSCLLSIDVC